MLEIFIFILLGFTILFVFIWKYHRDDLTRIDYSKSYKENFINKQYNRPCDYYCQRARLDNCVSGLPSC